MQLKKIVFNSLMAKPKYKPKWGLWLIIQGIIDYFCILYTPKMCWALLAGGGCELRKAVIRKDYFQKFTQCISVQSYSGSEERVIDQRGLNHI